VVQGHSGTAGQENEGKQGIHGKEKIYALSKSVQMMGKLHLDLFCQDKYLLNHVDLKIKLRRSRDAFALVADAANYKIKIKEMPLYVRKVQLSPTVRMGHVKALIFRSTWLSKYLSKTDPNVVFPSFVPTCLGPLIFSLA
jgi:hypothetical protein